MGIKEDYAKDVIKNSLLHSKLFLYACLNWKKSHHVLCTNWLTSTEILWL